MSGISELSAGWARTALVFGLDVAIKATILLLLAWLIHAALGRRCALARSTLWNACMVGLLCLPLASLVLPRFPLEIIAASQSAGPAQVSVPGGPFEVSDDPMHDEMVTKSPEGIIAERPIDGKRHAASLPLAHPQASQSPAVAVAATIGEQSPPAGNPTQSIVRPWSRSGGAGLVFSLYFGILALMMLRFTGSLATVARLRRRCSTVAARCWVEGRNRWTSHLGIKFPVELLRSDQVSVPAVVGCIRPAIILPKSLASGADPKLVDAILLHELGHVRRSDFGWNLLRKLVQIVYWPHPLAWLLSRAVGQAREQACDDLCVHGLGGSAAYHASLLEVASGLVRRPEPALGMGMARALNLSRRLAWIDQSRGTPRCLLRWPGRLSLTAAVVALAGLLGAVEPSRSKGDAFGHAESIRPESAQEAKAYSRVRPQAAEVASLDKVIEALRAEEEKYRDIEYFLRRTTRKVGPGVPHGPGDVQSQESRRVVLQGDQVWYRGESISRNFKTEKRQEEYSAYDGERTQTVIAGNSANIHLGRFEHPNVYPAHTVPLIHYHLNFPLSVYLAGSEAIHAHPKYGLFMREGGSVSEFPRVESKVEGEEQVDDLRCLKIRVNRWYYSKDPPIVQHLWLALTRNYLCIKERVSWSQAAFGGLPIHEMRAENLNEIAPNVWFPMKITTIDYDGEALRQKKQVVSSRTETVIEKVVPRTRHDRAFFRDIEIPAGLPVFTIREGKLVGSSLAEPIADEAKERAKLQEIVAKVHQEELRYASLKVEARVDYKHLGVNSLMEGVIIEQKKEERSVIRGSSAYFSERGSSATLGGVRSEQDQVQAFDGEWTRALNRLQQGDQKEQRWATLRKGGGGKAEGRHDGIPVLRPHTFLVRDDWMYGPLADLFVSSWYDKVNKYRMRFRYCGEEAFDGHPCVILRSDVLPVEGRPPHSFQVFWLAIDRNYIPIKVEHYGGNFGMLPLPSGSSRCEDFRQIAPGLWYPYRSTCLAFDRQEMAKHRLTLNWQRVYEVKSVTLTPSLDTALFRNVVVPARTKVQVNDEERKHLGQFDQDRDGVAEISPARYLALLSEAKIRDEKKQERQRAIDALIGKPAADFPTGATWLNGKPLTWASLRGIGKQRSLMPTSGWALCEWPFSCLGQKPRP